MCVLYLTLRYTFLHVTSMCVCVCVLYSILQYTFLHVTSLCVYVYVCVLYLILCLILVHVTFLLCGTLHYSSRHVTTVLFFTLKCTFVHVHDHDLDSEFAAQDDQVEGKGLLASSYLSIWKECCTCFDSLIVLCVCACVRPCACVCVCVCDRCVQYWI